MAEVPDGWKHLGDETHIFSVSTADHVGAVPPAPEREITPEERRRESEHEARTQAHLGEWGMRVYMSVSGLRWRCCWNLFEDEHSPWCQAGDNLDPFFGYNR